MRKYSSFWGQVFDISNVLLLTMLSLICILPFIYILAGSFSSSEAMLRTGFILFPTNFSLDGYRYIFSSGTILKSLWVSVYITVIGTATNLFFTCLMAYPLTRKDLDGRNMVMLMVLFTMIFSGGMIPTYLVVKATGLLDSMWSLIIPVAISAYNLIILKNFFQQIPSELDESAKMDGCNDIGILFRIILPLSGPALATFALFYAVGHWNSYFNAILYINDNAKWPIQVWLRQIVILSEGSIGDSEALDSSFVMPPAEVIKMAVIVIATVPILIVYPFLQKHFAKGVLLGSVKG